MTESPEAAAKELRFPYVLVDVTPDEKEVVCALLFEMGAEGVEERDAATLTKSASADGITLVASFASQEEAEDARDNFEDAFNPRIEVVIGDAWRDAWKAYFRPFSIAPGIVVKPPWESYEAKPGERVLELEPGRAFGTGLHETTSLVAGALASHAAELKGSAVLDVGTGSGILALAALQLGASRAVAIDVDPDAIAVTRENAARNDFSAQVDASTADIVSIEPRFPVVVANIEARVLIPMAPLLAARVAPGGLLLLSGILVPQKDDVRAAYPELSLAAAPEKGEWVLLVLRAPNASSEG